MYDFDMVRGQMADSWIAQEDREYYLSSSDLDHIRKGLDEAGSYELSLRGHYTGHPDEYMCRRLQHYYLDDQKNLILIVQSDVTQIYLQQQKDIEQAKREADRVQEIMNSIASGISVLYMPDPDHLKFRYVNRQMFRILGFSETGNMISEDKYVDGLVKNYVEDGYYGVHPDDISMLKKEFHDHYDSQHFRLSDYRALGKEGHYRWLRQEVILHEISSEGHVFYATYSDVSDEHRLQEELEEQRKKQIQKSLRDTMNSLPTNFALYRITEDNSLVSEQYSDEFYKMGGYSRKEELYKDDPYGGVDPEDIKMLVKTFHDHLNDNQPFSSVHRIMNADHQYFWVSVNFNTFVFDGQRYLYAAYTNIDSLKKQEARLSEQYNEAQAYLNSAAATCVSARRINLSKNFIETVQGGPFSINQDTHDYDEYVKELSRVVITSSGLEQFNKFYDRRNLIEAYEKGERNVSTDFAYRSSNGEVSWVRNSLGLIKRPQSDDIIAFSVVNDISLEKFTANMIETLVRTKYDSVGCIDKETSQMIIYMSNQKRLEGIHIGRGDNYITMNQHFNELFVTEADQRRCNEDQMMSKIIAHLDAQGSYTVFFSMYEDGKLRRKQREFFYLGETNNVIGFVRSDITEAYEKQLEQEKVLRSALQDAKHANEAKSAFLSRMSHDMRTPLNGIIGLTYLTEEMDLPEAAHENLKKIDTSSKFLLGLINDILDMTKAESGKVTLKMEPYSIAEFNEYLDAVIRPLCRERNLQFNVDESGVEAAVPLTDKLRINQVLFNLLSNAVKYTPEGGTITYSIHSENLPHDRVRITHTISDTGIGMSEEFQKKLFEPFTQEDRKETSAVQGSGLGLAIVKRMVDLMGGTISVKSELGKGSTFVLSLDFDTIEPEDIAKSAAAEEAKESSFNFAGRRVLLCEDHPLNQEIAKILLTSKGMIVDVADNGQIGLDMFKNTGPGTYDLILMDIRMPVMNGYDAAKAIRSLERRDAKIVPIVAMTADAYNEDVEKSVVAGMNGHIAKPIDPNHLFEVIQGIMQRS